MGEVSLAKSISIKECYLTLFYHLKKQLYYLYHTILQYLPHPKTLFLLKYYFLIFLYYFFPTVTFFQTLTWFIFLGFPTIFFFLSLPQLLAPVQHRATHADPWYINQSTQTHHHTHRATHTHKHKPLNHQQSCTHTQTIKLVGANNGHYTHHPSHQSANPSHRLAIPCRRFETHQSKPIQKKIITGATIGATDDQPKRSTHWSTNPPFHTHWSTDPNPPSIDPSPTIQTQLANPRWSNLQPQKSKTQHRCNEREVVQWEMRERPCEIGEKFRRWSFREERADGEIEKEEREENKKNERDEREISREIRGVKYYIYFLQYYEQCNSMFRIVL